MSYCGNPKCGVSTGICDRPTFGSGKLDDYGYWSRPCRACAAEHEKRTGEKAWPAEPTPAAEDGK